VRGQGIMLMLTGITASMPGGEAVVPGREFDGAARALPSDACWALVLRSGWMSKKKRKGEKNDTPRRIHAALRSSSRAGDEIEDFCGGLGGVGVCMKGRRATTRLGG
jgi:hypothetical protein